MGIRLMDPSTRVSPSAWETLGATTSGSTGTTVTSGGANTKGSWAQVDASLDAACALLVVAIRMQSSGGHSIFVDIGVGAAASESVVIPNLHVAGSAQDVHYFAIPVAIPAGSRIAARSQCSSATQDCFVMAYAQTAGPLTSPPSTVVTYGAETGDTTGISLDAGGSVNTKGSWTTITASTTAAINALAVNFGGQRNTSRTNTGMLVDIATGGSGSEVVLLSNIFIGTSGSAEQIAPMCTPPFVVPTIPSGTRLAARVQANTTDASDRLIDVILHAS